MSTVNYDCAVEEAREDDLKRRYPETDYTPAGKTKQVFRDYKTPPDVTALRPYYVDRLNRYFPPSIDW